MEVKIEKLSNEGTGIGYLDKIVFVPKSLPNDILDIKIVNTKKNIYEGKILEIKEPSSLRKEAICPFFYKCGGCNFLNTTYDDSCSLKLNLVEDLFNKNKINHPNISFIKNPKPLNYRNKITLKIINGNFGFYENESHDIVKIDYCYLGKDAINRFIKDISKLNIKNGEVTIRCNYNNELLIIIKSNDEITFNIEDFSSHRIIGVIVNDKVIYGDNSFIEIINNSLFKVSYNSFFQVNNYLSKEIFNIISENINNNDTVLDLYSGVGFLSVASKNAKKVYGVEIVKNAVLNALVNKKMNKINNIDFLLYDLSKKLKIEDDINTIIIDPPRSGMDENVFKTIKEKNPNKIIYVSCNPITLVRDLKKLDNYEIKKMYLIDMFSFTKHVECLTILYRKKLEK